MSDTTELRIVTDRVQKLKDRKLTIQHQRDALDAEEVDLDAELAGVSSWLKSLRIEATHTNGNGHKSAPEISYQLRGLSGRLALHKVADILGKRELSSIEATDYFVDSGFSSDRQHAAKTVFREFGRGVKNGEWRKLKPGVYERATQQDLFGEGLSETKPALGGHKAVTRAYCGRCKTKRPLVNGAVEIIKNGRLRSKGNCQVCDASIGSFGTL